jgi:hypothetical protein
MKTHVLEIVILAFLPLTLRTILYLLVCRLRSIHITMLNAIVLAGAGYVVGFVPIPIPFFLRQPIVIGVAMFLFARYTEAELFPDVIFIPLAIELSSAFFIEEVLRPMLV